MRSKPAGGRRLKILTWHVHGSYLYYLTQVPHDFYLLSKPGRPDGYLGRFGHFPFGDNVRDLPVSALASQSFDCVLFQRRDHYLKDQHELLTEEQRRLPQIYLEHDPPWKDPTEERHFVQDERALIVHVTPYNALMWDNGRTPVRVVEHGVVAPSVRYTGRLPKGIVVVNHLARRGRRVGYDVFQAARRQVPLDLVGMAAEEAGGLREVRHDLLPVFEAQYRFFFNPIRYTSLGLAVIEAMMSGMPVIGLATTEMATAIQNGVSGYVDTSVEKLVGHMQRLLRDPEEARALGEGARRAALARFGIDRFVGDWLETFDFATGRAAASRAPDLEPMGGSL
jgi:hypothetical protein